MIRLGLAIVFAPALAAANPIYTTDVTSDSADDRPALTAELVVGARTSSLNTCWRGVTRATARVAITGGRVVTVDVAPGPDRTTMACIAKALRTVTVGDSTADVIVTLELASRIKAAEGVGRKGPPPPREPITRVALGPVKAGPGLTAEKIDRVVKSRANTFRACYQKEHNRNPTLAGKLVIKFEIARDGKVTAASASRSSTLRSDAVSSCVTRQIRTLKFPANTTPSTVTYPFVFTRG